PADRVLPHPALAGGVAALRALDGLRGEPCGPPLRLRVHAGLARRARRAPAQAPAAAAGRRLTTRRGASPPFRNLPPDRLRRRKPALERRLTRPPSELSIGGPRRASWPRGAFAIGPWRRRRAPVRTRGPRTPTTTRPHGRAGGPARSTPS